MVEENGCEICGERELLPFKCKYCSGTFCVEHRLPEKHDCSEIGKLKNPSLTDQPFLRPVKDDSNTPVKPFETIGYNGNDNNGYSRNRPQTKSVFKKKMTWVYIALIIVSLIVAGLGYQVYSKYQPLIDYYNQNVSRMDAAYSKAIQFTYVERSDNNFLSEKWLNDFKSSIDEYYVRGLEAIAAGQLIADCPYYNKNVLSENDDRFDNSFKRVNDYYNAPTHRVELWDSSTGAYLVYHDGSRCYLTEYRNARDPTYNQLLSFLRNDHTEYDTYVPNQYVCTNFAIKLHDNAESQMIRAHIVDLDLSNVGHMIVAFNTIDKGMIYIDDTGKTAQQKAQGSPSVDSFVTPITGRDYTPQYLFPELAGNWYHKSMGTVTKMVIIS